MKLQLRADDKMPWGLHKEMTLRQIYREDREYYEYILTLDTIHISRETQTLLKSQKGRRRKKEKGRRKAKENGSTSKT